ncbi:1-acyl-sn-glycerol-3-phosphate acyltransferase [Campylobacter sp. 19-13652]|nr:1-acyl-sn-glycerol-3-phosphate acyltransferase [Campylobacter sp. 19-13652]
MLRKIKALFFSIEFIISIISVVIFMFCFRKSIHKIRQIWAKTQRFFGGYSLKVEGKLDESANMVILNHASMLDIVIMEEISPKNLCWVAKKEIGEIPIIGQILKIPKMIPLERSNPRAVVKMLKEAKERVSEGRVIAIFPEGTRTDGITIGKFKNGAKMLADKLDLNVQPVLLVGTNIMDSKRFSFGSGEIKVIFLPIVDTTDENWLQNTKEMMQARLDLELSKK